MFSKLFAKNLWHFEIGSSFNTKRYLSYIHQSINLSFVHIDTESGGFPQYVSHGFYAKSFGVNHLTTALLVPTLLSIENEKYANRDINDSSFRWISNSLHLDNQLVEIKNNYERGVLLLALNSLYQSDNEYVSICSLKNSLEIAIKEYEKSKYENNDISNEVQLSKDSIFGYSIINMAKSLENKHYIKYGIDIVNVCLEKNPFNVLLLDNYLTNKNKNIVFKIRPILVLIDSIINTEIIIEKNLFIDRVYPLLIKLHQKFEISRSLLKDKYHPNWKPASTKFDLIANSHIANIWFTVGLHSGDNLLVNSAFKMMDILRGVLLSNSTCSFGFPVTFPPSSFRSATITNNVTAKYFIDSSISELRVRQSFE